MTEHELPDVPAHFWAQKDAPTSMLGRSQSHMGKTKLANSTTVFAVVKGRIKSDRKITNPPTYPGMYGWLPWELLMPNPLTGRVVTYLRIAGAFQCRCKGIGRRTLLQLVHRKHGIHPLPAPFERV